MNIESITGIPLSVIFEEEYLPSSERIMRGNPAQKASKHYSSPCGQLNAGIWEGAVGQWSVSFSGHEYCEILAGVSVLRDLNGNLKMVKKGDRFVVPAGFKGTWEVLETCRKIYVVFKQR